jgi:transposase
MDRSDSIVCWLFVGADTADDRSAILYTVIESCRRRGLDPYAYLRDVLTRLPALTNRQVPEITPANWARSRPVPRSLAA